MSRFLLALIAGASLTKVVPQYLLLGFAHILPGGLDHILFIMGLFFLSRSVEVLLWQVTLFTVAHSLTLGLSLLGFASLPTRWVEVAIALSIGFIAVENLFSERLSRWRPWMVFGFGLVHGMGFAHAFAATSVSADAFLPALFSFNVGIELGQLVVVGLISAVVCAWWHREWYSHAIARPASAMIAATGFYWAIERCVA